MWEGCSIWRLSMLESERRLLFRVSGVFSLATIFFVEKKAVIDGWLCGFFLGEGAMSTSANKAPSYSPQSSSIIK